MASKLDQFFATLSRGTLATLAIAGGILFIILSDPPRNLCHAQLDYLKKQQQGFIFPAEDNPKLARTANFRQMGEYCKRDNTPGSCYEFFSKMRVLIRDLHTVPIECAGQIGAVDEIKSALWATARFMVTTAWGKAPPVDHQERFGWLDTSDVALFCSIKDQIIRFYGQSDWDRYRETLFTQLPGASGLQRKDAWAKMLLSADCRSY